MSKFDEINIARNNLLDVLGDKKTKYLEQMKHWFKLKITKEDFDEETRKLLSADEIRLHNKFLLQLFTKCITVAETRHAGPPTPVVVQQSAPPVKTKRKRKRRVSTHFEPAEEKDYMPEYQCNEECDLPMDFVYEQALPGTGQVAARFMVAAWENGLEGAEEEAAVILAIATQHFLKNVLTAIFCRRSGFKVIDRSVILQVGRPVPNPWLKNTVNARLSNSTSYSFVSQLAENGSKTLAADGVEEIDDDDYGIQFVPERATPLELEQREAFELACSSIDGARSMPVTPLQVFDALQVHRSAIQSHSVYANNMERIITKISHPSWDDMNE